MKQIELTGKYAVGEHRFALVDDADYAWLNQWRWKAKWNGSKNNIYAVRNQYIDGRRTVMLRMHREILALADPSVDTDHLDHNGLNNQRANLRAASRSENILNARRRTEVVRCAHCGEEKTRTVSAVISSRLIYCSKRCSSLASRAEYEPRETVLLMTCAQCGSGMTGKLQRKRYCSDACRGKAKRAPRVTAVERIFAALAGTPQTHKAAAELAGMHVSDARRLVARLVREGSVRVVGVASSSKRGAAPRLFQVASS